MSLNSFCCEDKGHLLHQVQILGIFRWLRLYVDVSGGTPQEKQNPMGNFYTVVIR